MCLCVGGACVCVSSWLHHVSSSLQLTYVRERKKHFWVSLRRYARGHENVSI